MSGAPPREATSRRRFLAWTGAVAASTTVGATAYAAGRTGVGPPPDGSLETAGESGRDVAHAFHGAHQSGIVTPAQDRMHTAAFDVTTRERRELVTLLKRWSQAAAALMSGADVPGSAGGYDAPPLDTGEATGLSSSGLTITIGFGPGLFRDAAGADRFGLASAQPARLRRLPHFPGDRLDPARSDGDLLVQACADDPQVAVHAVRNLARLGFGTVALRWSQLGFGRTSSTSSAQATPRNLFGFKDGTANLKAEETAELDRHLWVGAQDDPGAAWLAGGTYCVLRRIAMHLETWDRSSLREQEQIIGRDRTQGAPLSGGHEFAEPDFAAHGRGGAPLINPASHVAMAHPSRNAGVRILRRGYNYTDGSDALGRFDAGLFFVAFMRDPGRQYVPMQTAMARQDLLSEYLQHRGSALFAIPPGAPEGGWVGELLFT